METKNSTLSRFMQVGRHIKGALCISLPISFGQCETLRFIHEAKEPTMRDIAEYFKITAPSATALVNELARKGFVKRHGSLRDRRTIRLSVSPKGSTVLKNIEKRREKVVTKMLSSLSSRDRAELNRILDRLLANL